MYETDNKIENLTEQKMKHLQTIKMNTDSIIGKTLRYQDEWSGLDTEFEIKEAAKDTWREGYCLRGDGERDFFFLFDDELKKLATDGEAIRENRQRDGSIITETFTLR